MSDVATLRAVIHRRMGHWADVPIAAALRSNRPSLRPVDALAAAFGAVDEEGSAWLRSDATAEELGERAHDWLLEHNQFALVTRDAMVQLYAHRLRAMADDLETTDSERTTTVLTHHLRAHHEQFRQLVAADLGPTPADVVSGEYRPQLQLDVLGLPSTPIGPVLDVGCGRRAELVQHLRALGITAIGLDRHAPAGLAVRGDWLGVDYGTSCWTTITSHLGFALHFLHHHHAGHAIADRYARTYLRILRSLPPGGTFAYVPSLPFIEDVLDRACWEVQRAEIPGTGVTRTHVRRTTSGPQQTLAEARR